MTTNSITTVLLASALDVAMPMSRARENAVFARSDLLAGYWDGLGNIGGGLEALVDRLATRWNVDISTHMIERAYRV